MGMKPFLILQLRAGDTEADDEYQAILRYGGLREYDTIRVRMEQGVLPTVSLEEYAGVLVGGGPWNVSDPKETQPPAQRQAEAWLLPLMHEIIDHDHPYLGMCYGLGILAKALGGTVSKKRYGEAVGGVTLTRTHEGANDPLTQNLSETFRGFCGHKEAVQALPAKSKLLATGEVCPIQMIRTGKNIYATQFHTELDAHGIDIRVNTYRNHGYFEPNEADAIIAMGYQEMVHEPMRILAAFVDRYRTH